MIRRVDRETIESDFKRHWLVLWRFMCDHCCRDYKVQLLVPLVN